MTAPVALVLDGHGWAVRAVVRSLGAAGWTVIAPARTKSARSRYCAATVSLPAYTADVEGFCTTVAATIRDRGVRLVASITVEAVNQLGLAEGREVTAVIKASDVIIAVPD